MIVKTGPTTLQCFVFDPPVAVMVASLKGFANAFFVNLLVSVLYSPKEAPFFLGSFQFEDERYVIDNSAIFSKN